MTLEFIKCAALEEVYVSCFFPLWTINPYWFLWIIAYCAPQQKCSRLSAPSNLRRTRTHAHADATGICTFGGGRDSYVSSRCAVVKGRTRVVIRGVARRDCDVSKVSVGPIKANSSNHHRSRTVYHRVAGTLMTTEVSTLQYSIFSISFIWYILPTVIFVLS